MLDYKKGCLIQAAQNKEINIIAQQCNCFCTMKSGIAPLIAKAFPLAEQADKETEKGDINKLGSMSYALDNGVYVFNLYGQFNYGRDGKQYTNYKALSTAMWLMRNWLDENLWITRDVKHIGMPKLGCGLAGGDWTVVEKMIKEIFKGYWVTIYEL